MYTWHIFDSMRRLARCSPAGPCCNITTTFDNNDDFNLCSNLEDFLRVSNNVFVIIQRFALSQLAIGFTPQYVALCVNIPRATWTLKQLCFIFWITWKVHTTWKHFDPQSEFHFWGDKKFSHDLWRCNDCRAIDTMAHVLHCPAYQSLSLRTGKLQRVTWWTCIT